MDDENDMFKDKPIDDRGVPERLFDIAAEVDQVAPLAGLGALEGEVRGGDCREGDPGRERQALATHAPGEAVHIIEFAAIAWKEMTRLRQATLMYNIY